MMIQYDLGYSIEFGREIGYTILQYNFTEICIFIHTPSTNLNYFDLT